MVPDVSVTGERPETDGQDIYMVPAQCGLGPTRLLVTDTVSDRSDPIG